LGLLLIIALVGAVLATSREDALIALAEADPRRALALLERWDAPDPNAKACLVGRVQRQAGDPAAASRTLGDVPSAASCADQAALNRAAALASLGDVEGAVTLTAAVGQRALGPARDAGLLEEIAALIEEAGDDPASMSLRELALRLAIPQDRRREIALRLAADVSRSGRSGSTGLHSTLRRALIADDSPTLRRHLARLLTPDAGLALLETLSGDAPTLAAQAAVASPRPLATALLYEQLISALGGRPVKELERWLDTLSAQGLPTDAPLTALATGDDAAAERALLRLAARDRKLGHTAAAIARYQQALERFPSGQRRAETETALTQTLLAAARSADDPAEALRRYASVMATGDREQAARGGVEAGRVARAAGDGARARELWREVLARWPETSGGQDALRSLARQRALDGDDPRGALAWLQEMKQHPTLSYVAGAEWHRLQQPDLQIATGDQPGVVRLSARNLDEIELRVHRIDAEAFVRAGGTQSDLPELDVAVIAPDRRWTTPVPEARPMAEVAFSAPVRLDGPGLYTVTAASDTLEARTVLLVSDLELIARVSGDDLVVAVLRGGRPASGVEVLVSDSAGIRTARTDRSGLLQTSASGESMTIFAQRRGAPALLTLHRSEGRPADLGMRVDVDLDRPVYRAGDLVGLRGAALRTDRPLTGRWDLWIEDRGGQRLCETVSASADTRGAFSADLPLPAVVTDGWLSLRGLPPGAETPVVVGSVRVAATDERPSLTLHEGVVEARDARGVPLEGLPIRWTEALSDTDGGGETDARGRLALPAGPEGLERDLRARVPGTELSAHAFEAAPSAPPLSVRAAQDLLRPGEAPELTISGSPGPVTLLITELRGGSPEPQPTADPWVLDLAQPISGAETWRGEGPAQPGISVEISRERIALTLDEAPLTHLLAPLPAGRYRVRAIAADGRSTGGRAALHVSSDLPRLTGLPLDAPTGAPLHPSVEGRPALLTLEQQGIHAAALAQPGRPIRWETETDLDGEIAIVATTVDGAVDAHPVALRSALSVDMEITPAPERWEIVLRVTDAAGRPTSAQVALSAIDLRLLQTAGAPAQIDAGLLRPRRSGAQSAGGRAGRLVHGASGVPVAAALREEEARTRAALRAKAASTGRFGSAEALAQVPIALGAEGYGWGGGSFGGVGGGAAGGLVGGALGGRGVKERGTLTGERGRLLWKILETDARGEARLVVDAPRTRAALQVRAMAITEDAVGATTFTRPAATERLLLDLPAPRSPGGEVAPRATVVNAADTPLDAHLEVWVSGSATKIPVAVPAGEHRVLALDAQPAGRPVTVKLVVNEAVRDVATWTAPLAGDLADPGGDVVVVAIGAGGGLPLAALALEDDPAIHRDGGRLATRARAVLAAHEGAAPAEQTALDAEFQATRASLRSGHATAGDPGWLLALAAARGRFTIPSGEIAAAAQRLGAGPADTRGRLRSTLARLRAGLKVDPSTLARLRRMASGLTPSDAALLARVLIASGETAAAAPLITGHSIQAVLAARELGRPDLEGRAALLAAGPPPVGHPERPDWIRAVSGQPGRSTGSAEITLVGATLGALDLSRGGSLRLALEGHLLPTVSGADEPLIYRVASTPPPAPQDADPALALPIPAGLDGAPLADPRTAHRLLRSATPGLCGDVTCWLRPGDRLVTTADINAPGWAPPAGLIARGDWLEAREPGAWLVDGLRAPDGTQLARLVVEISPDAPRQTPALALAGARQAAAAGRDPEVWLAPWPAFDDWTPGLLAEVVQIRFERAVAGAEAAEIIGRFEELRDGNPSANLPLPTVAAVAEAYQETGQHVRAVTVWRAGLGAAFLEQAAAVRQLEDITGPLSSLQAMRELTQRWGDLPVVETAAFHLPRELSALAEGGWEPSEGEPDATDLRLLAAAWGREFIALHPDSPHRDAAALHLSRGLLRLRAFEPAARWSGRFADDGGLLSDRLRYLEGVALAGAGAHSKALAALRRVVEDEFPQPDGTLGPARVREDARYAMARLHEARGDITAALAGYRAVDRPEAMQAAEALTRVVLTPEPFQRAPVGGAAKVHLTAAGLSEVHVRAYQLDLRTIFLRDGGLRAVRAVRVAGVSPQWSGVRRLGSSRFPEETTISVPLDGPGAWLVRLDADGAAASTLLVRSALTVEALDEGGQRRLRVYRGQRPAAGVSVRALDGRGGVIATQTDVRGVAVVPMGAPALITDGAHVAFTDPAEVTPPSGGLPEPQPEPEAELMRSIDAELDTERRSSSAEYRETFRKDRPVGLDASML